jgi:hypothetical protein
MFICWRVLKTGRSFLNGVHLVSHYGIMRRNDVHDVIMFKFFLGKDVESVLGKLIAKSFLFFPVLSIVVTKLQSAPSHF